MRKLALFILLLAFPAFAQVSPAPSSTGSINASGTSCATTNACVTLPMYATTGGVSVTVSGTFSATLQPEQSGDYVNWSSTGLSTISAAGTTTYTTIGMIGFRIRASAYVSGTAVVTITAGVSGGGGGGILSLDQITNPVAAKTFGLVSSQTPYPLGYTYNGIFTSANNTQSLAVVTGGSCTYAGQSGIYRITSGIMECITTPSSGVTASQVEGISSFVTLNDSTSDGQFGKDYGFGLFAHVDCAAATMICEGNASSVQDVASNAGVVLVGAENDMYVNNTTTTGYGYMLSFRGTAQPTADNFPAFAVQQAPSASILSTSGFKCEAGSVATSGSYAAGGCLVAGPVVTGASAHSSSITFSATDAGSTQHLASLYTVYNTNASTPLLTEQASLASVWTSVFSRNTAQTAANITASTGWGGSGAAGNSISAVSGYAQRFRFTITTGTTGANPTITATFSDALPFAPLCEAKVVGPVGSTFGNFSSGTETVTSTGTMTFQGTPTGSTTYVIDVDCRL